jgi:hypothetical protein
MIIGPALHLSPFSRMVEDDAIRPSGSRVAEDDLRIAMRHLEVFQE